MGGLVIVGMQWGDEGKGKITDILTDTSDIVARYQGSDIHGHTVTSEGKTYRFRQIPSGILHGKPCIIGCGVIIDPVMLAAEINILEQQGINPENLIIDARAHIIMPYHKIFDQLRDTALGASDTGNPNKGMQACYMDKIRKTGIRVCDLINEQIFAEKLTVNLRNINNELTRIYNIPSLDFAGIFNEYMSIGEIIEPYVQDASAIIDQCIKDGKKVLFEGSRGTMSDPDMGTYPYVATSGTTSAAACTGTGVSPKAIHKIVGIAKAYCTRMEKGFFPTEIDRNENSILTKHGNEFLPESLRSIRFGWLDTAVLKYSARVNGITTMAITKLEALTGIEKLKICIGYDIGGEFVDEIPADSDNLTYCEPIYEEIDGWTEDISSARKFDDLCENAQKYIRRIEELTEVKVGIISVGADRKQTIIREEYFA